MNVDGHQHPIFKPLFVESNNDHLSDFLISTKTFKQKIIQVGLKREKELGS